MSTSWQGTVDAALIACRRWRQRFMEAPETASVPILDEPSVAGEPRVLGQTLKLSPTGEEPASLSGLRFATADQRGIGAPANVELRPGGRPKLMTIDNLMRQIEATERFIAVYRKTNEVIFAPKIKSIAGVDL